MVLPRESGIQHGHHTDTTRGLTTASDMESRTWCLEYSETSSRFDLLGCPVMKTRNSNGEQDKGHVSHSTQRKTGSPMSPMDYLL